VTFRDVGAPERGFPVETKTTSRSTAPPSSGASTDYTFVTYKVVVHLSKEPLDPALFEIPPGFRAAEGRLASFAAEWAQTWYTAKQLLAALFE
jgi:hypothetical protein